MRKEAKMKFQSGFLFFVGVDLLSTTFLATTFCVRAADTMIALLFLFVKINTDASYNED